MCKLCETEEESVNHLFLNCRFTLEGVEFGFGMVWGPMAYLHLHYSDYGFLNSHLSFFGMNVVCYSRCMKHTQTTKT